jgi:hypothetical protein
MIFVFIAQLAPVVEAVRRRCLRDLMLEGGAVGEPYSFMGFDYDRGTVAGSVALTLPNRDYARVPIGIDFNPILAVLLHGERHVGRVYFIDFTIEQLTHTQVERSLVKLHLHLIVADAADGQAAFIAHAQNTGAHVQLGT